MSSMPCLSLVSKHSTYVHDNYHQSRFHFIENFFKSIQLPFHEKNYPTSISPKNYFSSMELLFKQRTFITGPASTDGNNYFHYSSFYCITNLLASIQLQLHQKLSFINPASIYFKNYFHQ